MRKLAITDLEYAINYWREAESPGDGITLGPAAAILANIYGEMIYQKISQIEVSNLGVAASQSIQIALGLGQKVATSKD